MLSCKTNKERDAQGNVLAVYERRSYEDGSEELYLTEQHIYGSARLGMRKPNLLLAKSDEDVETDLTMSSRALGEKRYELTNHLGNVLAVVSDKRLPNDEPDVVSASDYYPYGMLMPDRSYDAEEYRYGFGGQEKDDEVSGEGNHLSFGDYGYDTRFGRRWNVDPIINPNMSNYNTFNDNPILFVDTKGKVPIIPIVVGAYYLSSKIMEKNEGNDVIRTIGYSMRHPINAFKTNGPFLTNYNDIATNFQVNIGNALGVKNIEGGIQNAIRHTLWQALLTNNMGAKAASRIGNAHETTTNIDINQRLFTGITAKADADRVIDLLNNQIGRDIGENNKGADNITMAKAVVTEFYINGLYTMTGNEKEGYKIHKTKLTKIQYETAIKEIDKKGQDGMNK